MLFRANHISTSVSGNYYQAMFEARKDSENPDSPYLLMQRQFEVPDGGKCYIETHDEKYIGHFLVRRIEFTPGILSIELDRPAYNLINTTFDISYSDSEKVARVVKIISQHKTNG
jgi:hypothetical protein